MATSNQRQPKPQHIQLVTTLGNRGSTTDKDGRMLNAFAEPDGKIKRVVKRPGMTSRYTLATGQGGATTGQLLFAFNTPNAPGMAGTSTLIGIRGDVLTRPVS